MTPGLRATWTVLLLGTLAACALTSSPSPSEVPSASGSVATPSPTESTEPTETATGSAQPLANACTSTQEAGFQIAYPKDWFANVGLEDLPDCRLFGLQPVQTADDPTVVVTLLLSPPGYWTRGPITQEFEGITILVDEEIQLGDEPAWVREFERTDNGDAQMDPGDRWIGYEVVLPGYEAVLPGDWLLTGSTSGTPPGPDYDALKSILRAMMTSVEPADL